MAKIVPRKFGTDLPADTDLKEVRWYFASADQADFVATVDATVDTLTGFFVTPVKPGDVRIALQITDKAGLEPGDWQLCAVAVDKAGNFGDAYQAQPDPLKPGDQGWTRVPLDFSPPGRCSNGSVD